MSPTRTERTGIVALAISALDMGRALSGSRRWRKGDEGEVAVYQDEQDRTITVVNLGRRFDDPAKTRMIFPTSLAERVDQALTVAKEKFAAEQPRWRRR